VSGPFNIDGAMNRRLSDYAGLGARN